LRRGAAIDRLAISRRSASEIPATARAEFGAAEQMLRLDMRSDRKTELHSD